MKKKDKKKTCWIWRDDAQKLINQMTNWQNSKWLRAGAPRSEVFLAQLLTIGRRDPI